MVSGRDQFGWSALDRAATLGRNQCIELLLDKGADVNEHNKNGLWPFHHNKHDVLQGCRHCTARPFGASLRRSSCCWHVEHRTGARPT